MQAQAEFVANNDQYDPQLTASPRRRRLGAHGRLQHWDVTVGRFQAFDVYPLGMGLDLNTYERRGAFDPIFTNTPTGLAPFRQSMEPTSALPARASQAGDVALHLYTVRRPLRIELLGAVRERRDRELSRRSAGGDHRLRLAEAARRRSSTSTSSPRIPRRRPRTHIEEPRRRGLGPVRLRSLCRVRPERRLCDLRRHRRARAGREDEGASGNRFSCGGFVDVAPVAGGPSEPAAGCGRQLRHASTTSLNDQRRELRALDEPSGLRRRAVPLLPAALLQGRRRLRQVALRKSATANPYDDDMFSRPRPLDVPLLRDLRRAVNLLSAVPLHLRNARRAICRR